MRRRDFITAIAGSAAAAWPHAARAQQPARPVVGFLSGGSADLFANRVRAFLQGLGETSYVDGQNVAIEYRWAEGQNERLSDLAADLVRRRVNVIAADGSSARAAKAATATIPIVFTTGVDPVEAGLVASLNRPGGNLTGVSNLNAELGPKRLELVHELVPAANTIALLINPTNRLAEQIAQELNAAARTLGLQSHVLHASSERELDAIFPKLMELRAGALVFCADLLFVRRAEQLAALALRHGMPTISQFREYAAAGGLMSYGGSDMAAYRQVGHYTGRILKGSKAADLPVVQSTKVELVINLKTARSLGLTVPLPLIGRADEVIE